jgi:NAD(P)-dependent dehydrogenase (short-subunit alcohol dehydrogenase family)
MAGFRGGRYISAEASARGEWLAGGSKLRGGDAYATAKQCLLVAALELARENPQLRINALEPGFAPATSLGRDANIVVQWIAKYLLGPLAPHMKYGSSPKRSGKLMADLMTGGGSESGVYFDEKGRPMNPSRQVQDSAFRQRVLSEIRTLVERAM